MNTFSRFAVLSPEVDLNSAHRVKTKRKQDKSKNENNNVNDKVQNKVGKSTSATINKKKKNENDLQALAFGFGKAKGNKKGNPGTGNKASKSKSAGKANKEKQASVNGEVKNDEDWQIRDEKFIKEQNEKCLREAILQSKLEFEENKKEEEKVKKGEERNEKSSVTKGGKTKKRKDKPITISLDQFNSLQPKELANLRDPSLDTQTETNQTINPQKFNEEKFFKDVEEATRRTLEKEHRQEQYNANANKVNKVNHEIQVKKFISEIEKRDFEIQALGLEVDSLRTQLQAVKSRNKKLCEVISFSEMRSKGELVIELEKATKGRDEFSEDISRLLAELEQERTKVSQLTMELKKLQGKKRNADSSTK